MVDNVRHHYATEFCSSDRATKLKSWSSRSFAYFTYLSLLYSVSFIPHEVDI